MNDYKPPAPLSLLDETSAPLAAQALACGDIATLAFIYAHALLPLIHLSGFNNRENLAARILIRDTLAADPSILLLDPVTFCPDILPEPKELLANALICAFRKHNINISGNIVHELNPPVPVRSANFTETLQNLFDAAEQNGSIHPRAKDFKLSRTAEHGYLNDEYYESIVLHPDASETFRQAILGFELIGNYHGEFEDDPNSLPEFNRTLQLLAETFQQPTHLGQLTLHWLDLAWHELSPNPDWSCQQKLAFLAQAHCHLEGLRIAPEEPSHQNPAAKRPAL